MGDVSDDMIDGSCCSLCGVVFEAENGYPVLCAACWKEHGRQAKGDPPITREGWQRTRTKEL